MGIKLVPYSIAIGEEKIHFLTPYFEFIKRGDIKSMEINENFIDLFDYRNSNCRTDSFKKSRTYKIHSNYIN